jgi:membrane-associated phospholipid phosphatase
MPVIVRPTRIDEQIARIVARETTPKTEKITEVLTWGADEHILCAAAAAWWLYCRAKPLPQRKASTHILITTLAASIVPHLLKKAFTQERPDRLSIQAHLHGAPFSGKSLDSFPSGHALHIGAIASAATEFPPRDRNLIWSAGAGLVVTRIVLLAHWTSDVAAGLAIGAALERTIRLLTGYGSPQGR